MVAEQISNVEETTVCCPIVYGSIAFWLGRKANDMHTHKWTLYVRGAAGEDLSYVVRKVVFNLHPSFAQPTREFDQPPFEVTEMGWGEFEANIKIYFHDEEEKPIDMMHMIKLYPNGSQQLTTKKPVIHEFYDEIVFTNPRVEFFDLLVGDKRKLEIESQELKEFQTHYDDAEDVQKIVRAHQFVRQEIQALKSRLKKHEQHAARIKAASSKSSTSRGGPNSSK